MIDIKNFYQKYKLLINIGISIILGLIFGTFFPNTLTEFFIAINVIISKLLKFSIPLIIIAFVTKGIGALESSSGKMLGLATLISYVFMISAAFFSYFVTINLFPNILNNVSFNTFETIKSQESILISQLSKIEIAPIMDVIPALLLSFIIGIGISSAKSLYIKNTVNEFHDIINIYVQKLIVPILPVYVLGIFAKMTASGQVYKILGAFSKVFITIILLHTTVLFIQYFIAGAVSHKNPFKLLKNMMPAYLAGIATQSSAAVVPITLDCTKKNGVSHSIADFIIPLSSTIHLTGSVISITSCSVAVMMVSNKSIDFVSIVPFMLILGVMMVAAPGVPCGAILAATGVLQSILGFDSSMISLIIALHVAQDGFGTACNVTGDGAVAVILNSLSQRFLAKSK